MYIWNLTLVITVSADALAPNGARASADTVLITELEVCPSQLINKYLIYFFSLQYELKPDGSTDTSPSVWKQGKATLQCFQRALELDGKSCKLWIEYGSLAYQLHSHASRRIKQVDMKKKVHSRK